MLKLVFVKVNLVVGRSLLNFFLGILSDLFASLEFLIDSF